MALRRILLVDGSRILRDLVKRVLSKSTDLEVVGEVPDLTAILQTIDKTDPQWIICFFLPNSDIPEILETLIARKFPDVRILGISMDGSQVKVEWIGIREKCIETSSLEELTSLLKNNWPNGETSV